MAIYQVEIIDPKADKLLRDLADMNLISIKSSKDDGFLEVVERLRSNAQHIQPLSSTEIDEEVEQVRADRYARRKA